MKCKEIYERIKDDFYFYPEETPLLCTLLEDIGTEKAHTVIYNGERKKVAYIDTPASFDIETTSLYYCGEKHATMYVWSFSIDGYSILGRTWEQFIYTLDVLADFFDTGEEKRLLIYVHNLSYEFAFFCQRFTWESVFSLDTREPCYCVTDKGIEFRCSYLLSGYSLAKIGENLLRYKINKKVGDLDYTKPRHTKTPLTQKEVGYCLNDIKVVCCYVMEKVENDGALYKIPLTKTGYVRRFTRKKCFETKIKRMRYKSVINKMTFEPDEFIQLKHAFSGGFTHANAYFSGQTLTGVSSIDFTSSYPTALIAFQYPMSKGEKIRIRSEQDFTENIQNYCCCFDIEIFGLQPKILFENYISAHKCYIKENVKLNNGRIVSADHIALTITEVDYTIINTFYSWDKIRVHNFYRYKKNYLPTDFIKCILKLYADKTTLKNIVGKEVEYLGSKEMLNSLYGMCVDTSFYKPEYIYDNSIGWDKNDRDLDEAIEKYNTAPQRHDSFLWGVWCTAYSRRQLFTGILAIGQAGDYVYSDTDSIKLLHYERHRDYIECYNRQITETLTQALKHHKIDPRNLAPKNNKGVSKPLGVWDYVIKNDESYGEAAINSGKQHIEDIKNFLI